MRLVIDGRRLGAGRTGVGRYLERLLHAWARSGPPLPRTIVVLKDPAGIDCITRSAGFEVRVVGARWPGLVWERFGLGAILRADDLLFAPTNLIPSCWTGRTVLVLFDTIQEVLPDEFPWHVRWRFAARYRRAAARADWIIAPSASTAREIERVYGVNRERIVTILPGIDPGLCPLSAGSERIRAARQSVGVGDAPYFLFVGKRSRRRNVPAIVEAFRRHRAQHPDHRLVFVGPLGTKTDDTALATHAGIHVAGHVEEDVLHGLMAGATALLYPSLYEGFGLPVVEALACGCPAITLRNSALEEAGGNAACYLEHPSAEEIARAMATLSEQPDSRAAIVARGLEHAANLRRLDCAARVKDVLVDVAASAQARFQEAIRMRAAGGVSASVNSSMRPVRQRSMSRK